MQREIISARQRKICILISDGMADKQIASQLHVSEETVGKELDHLFTIARLKNRNRAALVQWWYRQNERTSLQTKVLKILSPPSSR